MYVVDGRRQKHFFESCMHELQYTRSKTVRPESDLEDSISLLRGDIELRELTHSGLWTIARPTVLDHGLARQSWCSPL